MRTTIDYGIDLGTTNSAIACQQGTKPVLLQGEDGQFVLPSVVHVTAAGEIVVGEPARNLGRHDPANTAAEFKRIMGTDERRVFPASERSMSPEQMSAEILRGLLRRVTASGGNSPRAAVITVPAMFQLPQCEATRRAAQLAGIEHAPLLQEPIAAAIAHSGSGEVREGYWLIYDLGGGTFDVSLVRSRGGRLQVLEHDGDNHLGGRDFDRLIVSRAADVVRAEGKLGEFRRSDPAMADAFSRLKTEAERVRIALSRREQEEFCIESLMAGAGGEPVGVRFTLDRDALDAMLEPTIARTISLCRKLLSHNRIEPRELNGLVMVGGPTLTPCVPHLIQRDLGIDARHFMDPMHIVAAGAALFASTQKLPAHLVVRSLAAPDAVDLRLEYETMTTNPEPLLVGKPDPTRVPAGARIRISRQDGAPDTREAPVGAHGFAVELSLARNALNLFRLELSDAAGRPIPAIPSEIRILHGFSVAKPPLSQSVGIMLADNSVTWYLRRGAILPARNKLRHSTTIALRRGQSGEAIHVPMIQGESARGDRNKVIGVLRIHADKITRDLPKGAEVEVTLTVDESSQTTGRAYVPLLDQWFDDVVFFRMDAKDAGTVRQDLLEQKKRRLAQLENMADELKTATNGDGAGVDARVAEMEALIEEGDRDALDMADQMVRRMAEENDEVEEKTRAHVLTEQYVQSHRQIEALLPSFGDAADTRQLKALDDEFQAAMDRGDIELGEAKREGIQELERRLVMRHPDFWIGLLKYFTERLEALGKLKLAEADIQDGQRAASQRNIPAMAAACRRLRDFLPRDEREKKDVPEIVSHVK